MSGETAAETVELKPSTNDAPPTLSNSQLTQELMVLKRQNIELTNHIQNVLSRLGKLDRDVRNVTAQRRH